MPSITLCVILFYRAHESFAGPSSRCADIDPSVFESKTPGNHGVSLLFSYFKFTTTDAHLPPSLVATKLHPICIPSSNLTAVIETLTETLKSYSSFWLPEIAPKSPRYFRFSLYYTYILSMIRIIFECCIFFSYFEVSVWKININKISGIVLFMLLPCKSLSLSKSWLSKLTFFHSLHFEQFFIGTLIRNIRQKLTTSGPNFSPIFNISKFGKISKYAKF